jgi:acetamidase/formamidase
VHVLGIHDQRDSTSQDAHLHWAGAIACTQTLHLGHGSTVEIETLRQADGAMATDDRSFEDRAQEDSRRGPYLVRGAEPGDLGAGHVT